MYRTRKKGRRGGRSHHHRQPAHRRPAGRHAASGPLGDDERWILRQLYETNGAAPLADLAAKGDRNRVRAALERLVRRNLVQRGGKKGKDKKNYSLARPDRLVSGRISVNPRGFAFVARGDDDGRPDLFIPPGQAAEARHGDTVLAEIVADNHGRPSGRVIAVLEQAKGLVSGTYVAGRPTGMVLPAGDEFPYRIVIRKENSLNAPDNAAVLVELLPGDRSSAVAREGKIVEILGDADTMPAHTEMVIRKLELPTAFSPAALEEAGSLDPEVRPTEGRVDLRHLPHITIDGETARDFDDAVALIATDAGTLTLYVSIADVAHYVRPGSALDQEAYRRGTSVYFPDRVLPMLPERLSNDLCSLVPGEDRYAFTAILEFTPQGRLVGRQYHRSVIRSRHRMTYTAVKGIIEDRDPGLRRRYADIVPMLEEMDRLGLQLAERRKQRGSIGFEIPEGQIVLDGEGRVMDIRRRERNRAHKIIEEFMLAANEAVALTVSEAGDRLPAPFLYRIHEAPDPEKLATFQQFTDSLGLSAGESRPEPAWFGRILEQVAGTPREYIISNLMLRVMQQARYAPENTGHFGLAASHYTHFTSPIRRYPDLVVHRALAALLGMAPPAPADAGELGEYLSKRERVAVDAERETMDRAKALFLADKIGEHFQAVISGVTSFGLFVELTEHYGGGAIALADLDDDYYEVDERQHRLVGRRSGRTLQIGDQVGVRLVRVDRQRFRCDFVLDDRPQGGRQRGDDRRDGNGSSPGGNTT